MSCLNSGPVTCRVILDHGGYIPGDTILVSALIRNRSKIHIRSTKASLREVLKIFVLFYKYSEQIKLLILLLSRKSVGVIGSVIILK